jgi:ankyrin repeat protein
VNARFIAGGKTALMLAAEKGRTDIVELLKQAGAVE